MGEFLDEWQDLETDFKNLEKTNAIYLKKLDELTNYQQECIKNIAHQRYRLSIISKNIKHRKSDEIDELKNNIVRREAELQTIEQTLPRSSSAYLKVILGDINVSFLNKEAKFKYKDEYEKFKLILNAMAFVLALINLYTVSRPLEIILQFLLVWYYCTVSIRESILKVNGSRIKAWWRFHHILSVIAAGILLVWQEEETWGQFRNQFMWYTQYNTLIQYLQFKYQRGVLYRLKALGQRNNMDITMEGFHSWMWRGLTFLLPFLFIGQLFQLANSISLFIISYHPKATWHITVLSILFLIFFICNATTTFMVIPKKIKDEMKVNYRIMYQRVSSMVVDQKTK